MRIVPVMAVGQLFERKNYKFFDYFMCAAITLSAAGFMYEYSINNKSSDVQTYSLINGLPLLGVFFVSDAININYATQVFVGYKPTPLECMATENFWSALLLTTSSALTGTLAHSINQMFACRALFVDLLLMSLLFAVLQVCCMLAMVDFGAVGFAIMGTSGLVMCLVGSSIIYGHYLSPLAIVSVVLLFTFVFIQTYKKSR